VNLVNCLNPIAYLVLRGATESLTLCLTRAIAINPIILSLKLSAFPVIIAATNVQLIQNIV
jgi:hypothetical protein